MAFYSYLSTKIIIAFITKSYQDLFGVRSYINALIILLDRPSEIVIVRKVKFGRSTADKDTGSHNKITTLKYNLYNHKFPSI